MKYLNLHPTSYTKVRSAVSSTFDICALLFFATIILFYNPNNGVSQIQLESPPEPSIVFTPIPPESSPDPNIVFTTCFDVDWPTGSKKKNNIIRIKNQTPTDITGNLPDKMNTMGYRNRYSFEAVGIDEREVKGNCREIGHDHPPDNSKFIIFGTIIPKGNTMEIIEFFITVTNVDLEKPVRIYERGGPYRWRMNAMNESRKGLVTHIAKRWKDIPIDRP